MLTGPAPTAGQAGTFAFTADVADSGTATAQTASADLTVTVNPAAAITFAGTVPATATYNVAFTGSSAATGGAGALGYTATGLPTWLTLNAATGAIAGTPTAVGTFKFTVTAADAFGDSATQSYTITVNQATPALSFAAIPTKTYGDAAFAVSASSASTGAVTYSVTSGPATISGNTVTLTGVGTVILSASQAATTNYTAATATTSFTVNPEPVTLSFASISTRVYGDASFTASASSVSSGTITYSVTSGPATIDSSSGLVTLTGAGTVVLSASQAASGNYAAATASTSFTVNAALSITTASELPTGANGVAYSQQLAATGGLGTYTWSLTGSSDATNLAALGLSFSSAGVLSGTTPVLGGPVTFTAQVTDGTRTVSAGFSVTISTLAITTATLPTAGLAGSSYTATLAATGGSGSYSWSVTSGGSSLSAIGLSLNSSTGVLSGTLVAGSANFTVKVTDASSTALTATQNYSITVSQALALTPNPSPLPAFTSGQAYNGTITVSGGSGTYASFQVNDGNGLQTVPAYQNGNITLSSGFTLSMQHDYELIINGTPSITTSLPLNVKVTDSVGNAITQTFTLSPASALAVTVDNVPQGMVGMPYTFSNVAVSGATGPFSVTYTNTPTGLANGTSANNDANFLVGTPTASGTTKVTVTVTDSTTAQTVSATFNLTVVEKTVAAHNGYLTGQYACYFDQYWDGGVTGGTGSTLYRGGAVFAFAADGSGKITGGDLDHNSPKSGYKSASVNGALGGTYVVGADSRGYMLLTVGSSTTPVVFALAGGNLNSSAQFSEFAITEMDDAGTDPSGQHGSGHCYKQNTTTAFTGILPSGGYVFNLTGEDSSGEPESIAGSFNFTAGTGATTGTLTGVMDEVYGTTVMADISMAGTTAAADSYGRMEMAAGPTGSSGTNTIVVYLTNNTKGAIVLMSEEPHNGSNAGEGQSDFFIGEGRKQVATVLTASNPFTGSGVLYSEGTNTENASGSTPTYEAQMTQFTGSSAKTITLNSMIENDNGKFKKDSSDSTGQSMTYAVDTTTGRVTLTGQTGIYFYLYDTNSAAVIFDQVTSNNDGTSGTAVQHMTGWIEPQVTPTSGTWAAGDLATSYFMYKIENGNHDDNSQSSVLTTDGSGNFSNFAEDDGGQGWASWDESLTNENGTTETGAVALDSTDGKYGLLDVSFTESGTTTTESYCFAVSADAATVSGAKGKLVCLDADSNSPRLNIIQE